jgi:Bacterial SH3 domain
MRMFRRLSGLLGALLLTLSVWAEEAIVNRRVVLREEPSTSATKIRSLEPLEEVEVLDVTETNGFLRVETEDGLEGWVFAKFIRVQPPADMLLPEAAATVDEASTSISEAWEKPEPKVGNFKLDDKTCGPTGSGANRDKGTNIRKNRTDIPDSYHLVTWKAIAEIPFPRPAPKNRDKFEPEMLEPIAKVEGAAVQTVGYVVAIKPQRSSSEACNCGWKGEDATDWHIALVEHPGDGEASSIVVEPTPRLKIKHSKWTKKNLEPWLNSDMPVRISGWLLFDPSHANHLKKFRSTLWEIHPITKIEVWVVEDEQWVDLDDLTEEMVN